MDQTTQQNMMMPDAVALLQGSSLAPGLTGTVRFYAAGSGSIIRADICGLPSYRPAAGQTQQVGPFGFHIHEGGQCEPMADSGAFMSAGGHYNPDNQPHGNHAGDLPVLFSNAGCAHMSVYTDRFRPADVIGRTVVVHLNPDDFRTQPAGNSGPRIGCGVIVAAR